MGMTSHSLYSSVLFPDNYQGYSAARRHVPGRQDYYLLYLDSRQYSVYYDSDYNFEEPIPHHSSSLSMYLGPSPVPAAGVGAS